MIKKTIFLFMLMSTPFFIFADPPFITDSPEPADYKQLQIYPFFQITSLPDSTSISLPAIEFDYGIVKHIEVSLTTPILTYLPAQGRRTSGIGDTELGIQYQFLQQKQGWLDTSIAFYIEVPSGDEKRNLGNGKTWYKIPLSFERYAPHWNLYWSVGYAKNSAKFMNNFWYGGIVFLYMPSEYWTWGGELYHQTAYGRLENVNAVIKRGGTSIRTSQEIGVEDAKAFTLFNIGGIYNFNKLVSLQFAGGHTLHGVPEWYGYLGLLYTIK